MNESTTAMRDDAARRAADAREATLAGIAGVREIEVNVVYAVARKRAASESGNLS